MTTNHTTLSITGMTCSSCAHHIHEALRSLPGVIRVTVDRKNRGATVLHDTATTTDALITAILEAGYGATAAA